MPRLRQDHQRWAEEVVRTTGQPEQVLLASDHTVLRSDGQDLAFVTVAIADRNRLAVPRTRNHVTFEISGPGEIVGLDNGDATSFEPFQGKDHSAFNGLCLVIVRSTGQLGAIHLKAASESLKPGEIALETQPIGPLAQ